ncbi:hypothetical protein [Yokenella regensburgei]|uniref:hypothetical protein n=1 Tax=Yokenella regensburgei TaxID=158877 RepID=UPI002076E657|nr:hypothetical protein [Yokenella regensburgei]
MKKIMFILIFLTFNAMASFTGHWSNENASNSFTLDLLENGSNLTGKYCFITNGGNRIDCSESNNINGIVKGHTSVVTFESEFGGDGEASLSVDNNTLIFAISNTHPFINANMSVPRTIVFKKDPDKK